MDIITFLLSFLETLNVLIKFRVILPGDYLLFATEIGVISIWRMLAFLP